MSKIIKIHGCSGSGKTTAVRQYMNSCVPTRKIIVNGKPEAYQYGETYILGSYENTCGGMDTVGSATEVMALLDRYAPLGNVIFEGLLQSTYYGAMGTHSRKYGNDYIYAFLDTPIELCLERVIARRAASGRNNKFNPQLTRDKHKVINILRLKLENGAQMGFRHRVAVLRHDGDLAEQIKELLNG
jgi:thymidylate kinase